MARKRCCVAVRYFTDVEKWQRIEVWKEGEQTRVARERRPDDDGMGSGLAGRCSEGSATGQHQSRQRSLLSRDTLFVISRSCGPCSAPAKSLAEIPQRRWGPNSHMMQAPGFCGGALLC